MTGPGTGNRGESRVGTRDSVDKGRPVVVAMRIDHTVREAG